MEFKPRRGRKPQLRPLVASNDLSFGYTSQKETKPNRETYVAPKSLIPGNTDFEQMKPLNKYDRLNYIGPNTPMMDRPAFIGSKPPISKRYMHPGRDDTVPHPAS